MYKITKNWHSLARTKKKKNDDRISFDWWKKHSLKCTMESYAFLMWSLIHGNGMKIYAQARDGHTWPKFDQKKNMYIFTRTHWISIRSHHRFVGFRFGHYSRDDMEYIISFFFSYGTLYYSFASFLPSSVRNFRESPSSTHVKGDGINSAVSYGCQNKILMS